MKSAYLFLENLFEKFSVVALKIFGSSITFIIAVLLIIFWLLLSDRSMMTFQDEIRDIILSVTFLNFFIIQKTQNRMSAAMHLKLNELVKAHENASNTLLNVEKKSGAEIAEMEKKFDEPDKDAS